jgi:cytochrome c
MTAETKRQSRVIAGICLAALFSLFALPAADAADATHGQTVFKACAACHTNRPNALGPSLAGIYGRKAGALEDFHYSNAMKHADFVWDAANLKDYLADPQAKVKGNRMPFSGLQNPADIDDVIAYLRTLK